MCALNTSGLWSETFGTCTRDSGSLQSVLVARLKASECQAGGSALQGLCAHCVKNYLSAFVSAFVCTQTSSGSNRGVAGHGVSSL